MAKVDDVLELVIWVADILTTFLQLYIIEMS